MEKISIIVPVYNVESYLDRCVESLTKQVYSNIEIILIDDGSTDSCGDKCDYWATVDTRIRVVHKANGGLSDARNRGLDIACGEYIGFVDSDDYISEKMYNRMLEIMTKTNSDIVICDYERFSGSKAKEKVAEESILQEMDVRTALINNYGWNGEIYTVVWNKLYKRNVFEGVRFPIKKINEDDFTTYRTFLKANKICHISEKLYYYYYNDNSITANSKYLMNTDIYEAIDKKVIDYEAAGYGDLIYTLHKQYLDRIISRNRRLYLSDKKSSKKLHELYKEKYIEVGRYVSGVGYKIYFWSPTIYYLLLYILKR